MSESQIAYRDWDCEIEDDVNEAKSKARVGGKQNSENVGREMGVEECCNEAMDKQGEEEQGVRHDEPAGTQRRIRKHNEQQEAAGMDVLREMGLDVEGGDTDEAEATQLPALTVPYTADGADLVTQENRTGETFGGEDGIAKHANDHGTAQYNQGGPKSEYVEGSPRLVAESPSTERQKLQGDSELRRGPSCRDVPDSQEQEDSAGKAPKALPEWKKQDFVQETQFPDTQLPDAPSDAESTQGGDESEVNPQ